MMSKIVKFQKLIWHNITRISKNKNKNNGFINYVFDSRLPWRTSPFDEDVSLEARAPTNTMDIYFCSLFQVSNYIDGVIGIYQSSIWWISEERKVNK